MLWRKCVHLQWLSPTPVEMEKQLSFMDRNNNVLLWMDHPSGNINNVLWSLNGDFMMICSRSLISNNKRIEPVFRLYRVVAKARRLPWLFHCRQWSFWVPPSHSCEHRPKTVNREWGSVELLKETRVFHTTNHNCYDKLNQYLFPDHDVVLVVAVVRISQFSCSTTIGVNTRDWNHMTRPIQTANTTTS